MSVLPHLSIPKGSMYNEGALTFLRLRVKLCIKGFLFSSMYMCVVHLFVRRWRSFYFYFLIFLSDWFSDMSIIWKVHVNYCANRAIALHWTLTLTVEWEHTVLPISTSTSVFSPPLTNFTSQHKKSHAISNKKYLQKY